MDSTLSNREIAAILQLIELRRSVITPAKKAAKEVVEEEQVRISDDESSSSSIINPEKERNSSNDDCLPRINQRFGSLIEIYRRTEPPPVGSPSPKKKPRTF
ncbi:hypothetical protein M569_00788 [Genlisea aurea]|uniref:Uncharacterized protein n=1 Tax=Genlisea aurea TaxID=192259 RepID=S8D2M2_9LAMI|nr:hypothetical protein M569_00788 [Genlisea aurea]